jgi:hypothetical protein
MRWHRSVRGLLPALLFLGLLGCGQGGPALVPVSGRITVNGQPLPEATVFFRPQGQAGGEAAPDAIGKTDAEGRYTLKTITKGKDREGTAAGKYLVQISLVNRTVGTKAPHGEQLPARYNRNSKLEFTVSADGTDKANFDVKK